MLLASIARIALEIIYFKCPVIFFLSARSKERDHSSTHLLTYQPTSEIFWKSFKVRQHSWTIMRRRSYTFCGFHSITILIIVSFYKQHNVVRTRRRLLHHWPWTTDLPPHCIVIIRLCSTECFLTSFVATFSVAHPASWPDYDVSRDVTPLWCDDVGFGAAVGISD